MSVKIYTAAGLRLLPKYSGDAGVDVPMPVSGSIGPGETKQFTLNVTADIPPGWFVLIQERSSVALQGLSSIGNVIDSGYTGTLTCILVNHTDKEKSWGPGDRLVQLVAIRGAENGPMESTHGARGSKGFGSTGRSSDRQNDSGAR